MSSGLVIHVNGRPHVVQAPRDTPLLLVLRDELGLNSAQYGCGLEQCGTCMVLIGNEARFTCRLPVSACEQIPITTLEGLSTDGQLHPVQRAFIDEQAAQCGLCTSGIMIRSVALLRANPHPSDEQIRAALDGNLCRCGAHLRVLRAVRRAADLMAGAEG